MKDLSTLYQEKKMIVELREKYWSMDRIARHLKCSRTHVIHLVQKYAPHLSGRLSDTGICEICKLRKLLVHDHNHKRKRERGKICNSCNTGLVFFKDSPEICQSAIAYLLYYDGKTSL